jgi:hypothetical protein
MIYFTKYAEQKFDFLNAHKVYIRKEAVERALLLPEKRGKVGEFLSAEREGVKVIYQTEAKLQKIITFYPV